MASRPRTKAPKGEQLTGSLIGELATYEQVGLPQHAVGKKTAYRYRGVLLMYQNALNGQQPSVALTKHHLGQLRKHGFAEGSIYIHRAALLGFHQWRGEHFTFAVRRPKKLPKYIEPTLAERILGLSRHSLLDHLVIRLMSDGGLRREEVVNLKVGNVGEDALRFAGKRGRERTVPLTVGLKAALAPFVVGKAKADTVVGVTSKYIYSTVKQYGRMAGDPALKPHDMRHYFCERLHHAGVPLRVIQELAGHESIETTQVYVSVTGDHLEQAIRKMEAAGGSGRPLDKDEALPASFALPMPLSQDVDSPKRDGVWVDNHPTKPPPKIEVWVRLQLEP